MSYRKWAAKPGVPLSSLRLLCKRVRVRRHTRWVKPTLTDKQRVDRVGFVLNRLHRKGRSGGLGRRHVRLGPCGREVVLLDEGWKKCLPVTGRGGPQAPESVEQAVHPQDDVHFCPRKPSDEIWFDRKISIWPIVDVVTAQGASKSRAKGDLVLRPVTVDGEKYKMVMIDEIIPAIKARMSRSPDHTIFVQQDGVNPHSIKGTWRQFRKRLGTASY
ncbi:unnamed protein product [Discosporangium mesarthrocarpum]